MSSSPEKKDKKDWIAPKASFLSQINETEGKILITLPEGNYPTKSGGQTPGGS